MTDALALKADEADLSDLDARVVILENAPSGSSSVPTDNVYVIPYTNERNLNANNPTEIASIAVDALETIELLTTVCFLKTNNKDIDARIDIKRSDGTFLAAVQRLSTAA